MVRHLGNIALLGNCGMGCNKPLTEWDSFISTAESMGINDVVAAKEAAYQR